MCAVAICLGVLIGQTNLIKYKLVHFYIIDWVFSWNRNALTMAAANFLALVKRKKTWLLPVPPPLVSWPIYKNLVSEATSYHRNEKIYNKKG